ncbi:ScyD/ScyE family protein [Fodinibius sediminis]|uniref:ScyD/ScyE family protein n=1 Tax=Fodinibius sediminis TaxID=1214077 RepID=A0A521EDN6_9BACT|nr:ScyD/ScyE family protein [Fodinibius sediminis]SMO82046.1 hypothetical protein SAMN06265218_11574 [Fodinibius sediminis]
MKTFSLFSNSYSIVIGSCIALLMLACSEHNVATTVPPANNENVESVEARPLTILSSSYSREMDKTRVAKFKNSQNADNADFVSPLFGLSTAPNGDILIADAGAGVVTLDSAPVISLPGITDMSPIGRGEMWAIKGLSGSPGDDTGQALYRLSRGNSRVLVDLFEFEKSQNPDGENLIDSNPFDVQSLGGGSALVVDAAGNDLLEIDRQGNVKVVAVFPNELVSTDNFKGLMGCPASGVPLCELPDLLPAQPVPTSIAIGPEGHYYVGELKGFPAPINESNIWRISPDASGAKCGSSPDCVKVFDGGFTSIIDMRFDSDGKLHIAELDEQSWFAVEVLAPAALSGGTINSCDLDAVSCSEVASNIPILTALAFGKDGTLWATRNALIPGLAEVTAINQ